MNSKLVSVEMRSKLHLGIHWAKASDFTVTDLDGLKQTYNFMSKFYYHCDDMCIYEQLNRRAILKYFYILYFHIIDKLCTYNL